MARHGLTGSSFQTSMGMPPITTTAHGYKRYLSPGAWLFFFSVVPSDIGLATVCWANNIHKILKRSETQSVDTLAKLGSRKLVSRQACGPFDPCGGLSRVWLKILKVAPGSERIIEDNKGGLQWDGRLPTSLLQPLLNSSFLCSNGLEIGNYQEMAKRWQNGLIF